MKSKIAVVGATGRVGHHTVGLLEQQGHEVVSISRSRGIDVISGDGHKLGKLSRVVVKEATLENHAPRG